MKSEAIVFGFFHSSDHSYYYDVYSSLNKIILDMQYTISLMRQTNSKTMSKSLREKRSTSISQAERGTFLRAKHIEDEFKSFGIKINSLSPSKVIDENNYGKVNEAFLSSVSAISHDDAVSYISGCELLLGSKEKILSGEVYSIDVENIIRCAWVFATEKPFSASYFQRAENVFFKIYRKTHADLIIADMYVKKTIGGKDALRYSVKQLLEIQEIHDNPQFLTLIASGLKWMDAIQTEYTVLQYMLATGKEMSSEAQKRLNVIANAKDFIEE